jgi:hypothetical protein
VLVNPFFGRVYVLWVDYANNRISCRSPIIRGLIGSRLSGRFLNK